MPTALATLRRTSHSSRASTSVGTQHGQPSVYNRCAGILLSAAPRRLARSLATASAECSSASNRCGAMSPSHRVGWKANVDIVSSRTKARYTSWLAPHRAAAIRSPNELRMQKQQETRDEPYTL